MADEGFKRKLTAILSADVEGYSRLMDDDEESTIKTITSYRTTMSDLIQQNRGRVVDSTGDNLMAEFRSAVDAVNCAVEIQRELAERNAQLPYERKMEFRIGVNVGDVVEEEGRIYGDGVNIAARVEAIAEAGGICITGRAYDQVSNKLGLKYEHLGEHQVKNISTPIRIYRVHSYPGVAAHRVIKTKKTRIKKWLWVATSTIFTLLIIFVLLYWKYYYLPHPIESNRKDQMAFELSKGPSIAVLPFVNMNNDPKLDTLCDGITENIISALSHVPQLFVIARNSAFAYKGKSINAKQIGHELGTQYVIEGSIQKSNERIRITLKLTDTNLGHHKWSERFDRELKDIFKLQDDIAIKILKAMQIHLTEGYQVVTRFEGVNDLQTFIKLNEALNYHRQFTKEGNIKARKIVRELIDENKEFTQAYVLLGFVYLVGIPLGTCESSIICFGQATEAARKALSLDGNSSDAHMLASALYSRRKEFEKAIAEGKRAIMLNPNNADAYCEFGLTLVMYGRYIDGIQYIEKAMRLNPIPPAYYSLNLAHAYFIAKQYENAIAAFKKVLEQQSDNIYAFAGLAATYALLGQEKKAKAASSEVLKLDPSFSIKAYGRMAPSKNPSDHEPWIEGLQKAGLPD